MTTYGTRSSRLDRAFALSQVGYAGSGAPLGRRTVLAAMVLRTKVEERDHCGLCRQEAPQADG